MGDVLDEWRAEDGDFGGGTTEGLIAISRTFIFSVSGAQYYGGMCSDTKVFGQPRTHLSLSVSPARLRGFTLTELLVATVVALLLSAMTVAALSASGGHRKKVQTRALISKIDSIIEAQYSSYAGRNVDVASGTDRSAVLRGLARGDLPDQWSVVAELAAKPTSELTPHQQAYAAVWNSLDSQTRQGVAVLNSGAECLFLAVMHGGLSDCLDCGSLHIDVGDVDGDGMPEFLDAWGRPIGFVLEPKGLQLPAGGGKNFFASVLAFEPVVVTRLEAKGGLIRPLVVSAGPDGVFGLSADAAPEPGSTASRDNLTNFDEEARG